MGVSAITLEKSADQNPATVGSPVVFTINLTANQAIANVSLKDTLTGDVTIISATPSGTIDPVNNTVTWAVGNLSIGETRTFTVTVIPKQAGIIVNTAQATSDGSISSNMPIVNVTVNPPARGVSFTN